MTPRDIAEEAANELDQLFRQKHSMSEVESIIERAIERALRGQWVSVEERLPKDDLRVVVCLRYSVGVGYFSYGKWVDETEWVGDEGCHTPADVTHWQPLPPPPTKEQT